MAAEETGEAQETEIGKKEERRRHRRFGCDLFAEAVVSHRGSMFRGQIRDLSQSGCFIETRARLKMELLTMVEIRFRANDVDIHASARVMALRPGRGVGLEFQFLDLKTEKGIRAMIEKLDAAASTSQSESRKEH